MKPDTILQHGGYDPEEHGGHHNPPLYLDIAPVQKDLETAAEIFADSDRGFTYLRKGHANARILEKRLAMLEGGEDALVFSTGMAATNCLMLELVPSGRHFVSQRAIYGGTFGFFDRDLTDAGRTVTFVKNQLDIAEWENAIKPDTAAIWIEMPSNPTVGLTDLEAVVTLAVRRKIPVVVDNTFAPILWQPLKWGASFVLRSGSKYENPGNTSMLGLVVGPHKTINAIRNGRYERMGAPAGALECWLAEVGMRTLSLRMRRQSDSALAVAQWLETHTGVEQVHYPALASSPYHALSRKYLPSGCGAILAAELKGGEKECAKFVESLRLFSHVINLGDTRSLVTYPAGTTHSKLSKEAREAVGITDSLIRFSIGLEDPEDLIEDLSQALGKAL